jgi:hypothetical protein
MKKALIALLPILLSGCMMPNYNRLVPENKDANIFILSPIHGQIIIQTRVNPKGNNQLSPLKTEVPTLRLD